MVQWKCRNRHRMGYLLAMGITSRVRRAVVAGVGATPDRLRRLVVGEPVERDGMTLHPDMQALLALMARVNPDPSARSFSRQRRELDAADPIVGGTQPIGAVTEREIAGPAGSIRLRLYTPRDLGGPSPALVYFHGGGFALGSLTSHDTLCRYLAEQAQVRVAAVDYRLAPEHPFPAGVCLPPSWSRRDSTRCATRVRPMPLPCTPPASRSRRSARTA